MSVDEPAVEVVEVSESGDLLVGVEGETCSVAVSLSESPDEDDVEETLREAIREAKHTARVRWRGDP